MDDCEQFMSPSAHHRPWKIIFVRAMTAVFASGSEAISARRQKIASACRLPATLALNPGLAKTSKPLWSDTTYHRIQP